MSEKGLQISRTKVQSILDFTLPTVSKQLKSFLGTANYLRDFVKGYSTISQPLHQLLTDYNKTRRVVWTPESTAAFHEIKLAISKCTTIYKNIHKEYLPNSYVLIHYRTGLPPTRLHTNWKGPMRVVKGLDSRYTLLKTKRRKPFVFDSALVDPLDIA